MNAGRLRLSAWMGPFGAALFFFGIWPIAKFMPPPPPSWSAVEIGNFYQEHALGIRVGFLLTFWAAAVFLPWIVSVGVQMQRIEGRWAPMTWTWLGCGFLLTLEIIFPSYFFEIAAFRATFRARNDELIQLLNDIGWIPYTGFVFTWIVSCIALAIVILTDKREKPIYPRWCAYYALWGAVVSLLAELDVFFVRGPLGWNGVLTFWLTAAVFTVWAIILTVLTLKAIKVHEEEHAADSRSAVDAHLV